MSWISDMTPKLKNWRWWVCLPIVMFWGLLVLFPLVCFEIACSKLHKFSEFINIGEKTSPNWFSKMIDWSDLNDK